MKAASTKRFVLDASVALAWCFEDETTPFSEAVLDSFSKGAEAIAPSIWPFEVANALLAGERRKRISVAQVTALLRHIAGLSIAVEPIQSVHAFEQVLAVARERRLSEYDAAYLELARREGLPLATLDGSLRHSARGSGITVPSL